MAVPTYTASGLVADTVTSGDTCTPGLPAGVGANDLMFAIVHFKSNGFAPVTPPGWALLDGPRDVTTPATNGRMWTFGRIADGATDAAPAFGTQATTDNRVARVFLVEGNRSDSLANAVGGFGFETASAASMNDTAVTTPENDCLAINWAGIAPGAAPGSMGGATGGSWTEQSTTSGLTEMQTAPMPTAGTIDGGSSTLGGTFAYGQVGFYIRAPEPAAAYARDFTEHTIGPF